MSYTEGGDRAVNKSKLVATGLLLAVFISGLIVGGAASALADRNEEDETRRTRRPYHEVLQEKLSLTEGQHDSIESILHDWRTSVRTLYDERDRRLGVIRKETRAEIVSVLDETQSELYQQMISRDDSIRAERSNRRRK